MKNNLLLWQVFKCIIISILIISFSSCRDNPRNAGSGELIDTVSAQTALSDSIFIARTTEFEILPIAPNPFPVLMPTIGESEISAVFVSASDPIEASDTLIIYENLFQRMQSEQIQMELNLALLHYDSIDLNAPANRKIDSLSIYLEDLSTLSYLFAETDCRVISTTLSVGDTVVYGDTLLFLISLTDSLYDIQTPAGWDIHYWPEVFGSSFLLEYSDESAVYSGICGEIENYFSRIIILPRGALYEDGLDVFIITVSGDTIPIHRIANLSDGDIAVLPNSPVIEALRR